MPAHPSGVGAAARKSPLAGDAVAALDDNGLGNTRGRPPREQRVGCPKDLACNFRVEKSGRVRARDRLCKTPGRTRVGRCDRLDDLMKGEDRRRGVAGSAQDKGITPCSSLSQRPCVRKWSAVSAISVRLMDG